MSEHYASLLWIIGGALVLLALWYLSYRYVRWDTRRRRVRELERKAWVSAAVLLPLFGFALYLFVQVLQRYFTPPPDVLGVEQRAPLDLSMPAVIPPQQVPMPGPVNTEVHKNVGAQAYRTPATVRAQHRLLHSRFILVSVDGPHVGQEFPVVGFPVQIGRRTDAAIALEQDLNVSRRHAEIYEWNGTLHLRDLGSAHGTYVNGSRVVDQPLGPGDRLVLGKSTFILRELPYGGD